MSRLRSVPLVLLLLLGLLVLPAAGSGPAVASTVGPSGTSAGGPVARRSGLPSKQQWLRDVDSAMRGAGAYLDRRAARRAPGERLAIVLDIDNTSLATQYAWPRPVKKVRAFARRAAARGMTVLFATGRTPDRVPNAARALRAAGYRFADICARRSSQVPLQKAKVRCRTSFERRGYTIVAVVGNRLTDLRGGHAERGFKLPSYHGRLS